MAAHHCPVIIKGLAVRRICIRDGAISPRIRKCFRKTLSEAYFTSAPPSCILKEMPRPQCQRNISFTPPARFFKPAGTPLRDLKELTLEADEMEALRLADYEGMYNQDAAKQMGVSRQTLDRILNRARKIVAEALVNGNAIRIRETPDSTAPKTDQ